MNAEWNRYFQQLNAYMQWQTNRLNNLEQANAALRQDVEALKQQKGVHIDRIEYKFDQLKVEKLEGTLNIGIAPSAGDKSLEDVSVGGEQVDLTPMQAVQPEQVGNLCSRVFAYLDGDCYDDMKLLEEQYGLSLDPKYRSLIVRDLHKQMEERIRYYIAARQAGPDATASGEELEAAVFGQVKNDIHTAIERHFQAYQQMGGTET